MTDAKAKMKSLLFLFIAVNTLISSCNSNTSVILERKITFTPEAKLPTATFTSTPKAIISPTLVPTNTLLPRTEPGLIVTLGEKIPAPWSGGKSPFSPDGQIIALASSRIRFWNVATHELVQEVTNPYADKCGIWDAKFSQNGKYFAASVNGCWNEPNRTGHLLIWDMSTYKLIQDWPQQDAHMPSTGGNMDDYVILVDAMTFLPNSTGIIFANGNTLEIRDVLDNAKHDVIKLGPKMYATQVSTSSDGRLAYIIMSWTKDHNWPSLWTEQQKLQIWNINTHAMLYEKKYPEGWANLRLELLGTRLAKFDYEKSTSQVFNLETEEVKDLPFRLGWRYYNSDGSLVLCARLFGFGDTEQVFELWNTDTWRNIYTFMPDFGTDWIYGMHDITFSPDNTIIAIQHGEQVSLWNIGLFIQP
jgi:WD40 repeat protein